MKKNVKIRTPEKIKTDVNIVSFCIHALRFIPGNFVFFITRVWWLAFLMFACSAVTLYFAEQMTFWPRFALLFFYLVFLSWAYATAAVFVCRSNALSDRRGLHLRLGKTEFRYMRTLLNFWIGFGAIVFGFLGLLYLTENADFSLETTAFILFFGFIVAVTAMVMLINLLPVLPSIAVGDNMSLISIWRLSRGIRCPVFSGSVSLLLLVALLAAILIVVIPSGFIYHVIAIIPGICIFFLDVSWQGSYLSRVYNFLRNR
ncbi:MAG: hypothetical protein Q4D11_00575 [Rhodospirillales bacterium]|nr:hypothetical protein [Rhodospirillales bacterium]